MNDPEYLLLDQTLREGSQQCGARWTPEQRVAMVGLLEDFGHRLIEVGHPGISPDHEKHCAAMAEAARESEVLMHSRAVPQEVRAAHRAGAQWVGIWASVNPVAMATKFNGHTTAVVLDRVREAVTEAKRLGLQVRFTAEDTSRTSWDDVRRLGRAARAAGADRISLADTTGCWDPPACARAVTRALEAFGPGIEVHLHDDLGLAHANALAAIDAGVQVVDVATLGIGERAGIVDGLQLATSLRLLRGDDRFDLGMVPALARAVTAATGYRGDALRPVTGDHVFTHSSAYHVKAVRQDPGAYEFVPPELVGRTRVICDDARDAGQSGPPAPGELQVGRPFAKGASELRHHRDGPGVRWVMLDSRVDQRASFYVIQRHIEQHPDGVPDKHVDPHTHHCDSAFLFWGDEPGGTGLECQVQVGESTAAVSSPACVFIPAGIEHTYHYVSGQGTYTNIVLAPEYNSSLLG